MIRPLLLAAMALANGVGCGGTRPTFDSALRPGHVVVAPLGAVIVFATGLGADDQRVLEAALVEDIARLGGDGLLGGGREPEGIAEMTALARARGAAAVLRVALVSTEVIASYSPPIYDARAVDDRFGLGDGAAHRLDIPDLTPGGGTEYRPVARFQASLIDVASATEIWKAEGQVRGRVGARLKELLGTASGRTVAQLRADGLL